MYAEKSNMYVKNFFLYINTQTQVYFFQWLNVRPSSALWVQFRRAC